MQPEDMPPALPVGGAQLGFALEETPGGAVAVMRVVSGAVTTDIRIPALNAADIGMAIAKSLVQLQHEAQARSGGLVVPPAVRGLLVPNGSVPR
jgi:hypothetical protein